MDLFAYLKTNDFTLVEEYTYTDTKDVSYIFEHKEKSICIILDDFDFSLDSKFIFKYDEYTQRQNRLFSNYDRVYRFLVDDLNLVDRLNDLIHDALELSLYYKDSKRNLHAIDNTPIEASFESIFEEAFPYATSEFMEKEVPFPGDGDVKFIDYVFETDKHQYAVEINGVSYHHPELIGITRYMNQIDRQNLLSYYNYKVLRFSTEDIRFDDKMVENLRSLVDGTLRSIHTVKTTRSFDIGDYQKVDLYEHQEEILEILKDKRKALRSAYLVVAPTASGKTFIACMDMLQANITKGLVIVPTTALKNQWEKELETFKLNANVNVITMQGLVRNSRYYTDRFYDYTVIDEAHHAQAPLFSKKIKLLDTKFLLGLTATPERLDKRSLTEIFGHYETTMSMKEGIERGLLSPFRVFRLISDINLSEVRINGKEYVNTDLERTLRVESRNTLIAKTLKKYFKDYLEKKGIVFCVNVNHAHEMARLINDHGMTAEPITGNVSKKKVAKAIDRYKQGKTQFLTAVNILTEGFDAPKTEVLVMARPTLSKVVYLQQLGRGLRNAPNKKALYVIDVVDNYGPLGGPWNANSVFGCGYYAPFIDPVQCKVPTSQEFEVFNLFDEEEMALKEIDIHTFEEKYGNHYSIEEAARELFINTGTLRSWLNKGEVEADAVLPFGKRHLYLFKYDTLEKIREQKDLKRLTDENIKNLFFSFLEEKTYVFSFKMVFMLAFLKHMDKNGNADIRDVLHEYVRFFEHRIEQNRQIDRPHCAYNAKRLKDTSYMMRSMLNNPFEKFERKRFIFKQKDKDLEIIGFNPKLYDKLETDDIKRIESMMKKDLREYYEDMDGLDDNNPILN
ncbi:MAG: DEAD/DEAH box helicase [Thermotogota bacterium]